MKTLFDYINERFVSKKIDFKKGDIVYITDETKEGSISVMFFEIVDIISDKKMEYALGTDMLVLRTLTAELEKYNDKTAEMWLKPSKKPVKRGNGKDVRVIASFDKTKKEYFIDEVTTSSWVVNKQVHLYKNKPIYAKLRPFDKI